MEQLLRPEVAQLVLMTRFYRLGGLCYGSILWVKYLQGILGAVHEHTIFYDLDTPPRQYCLDHRRGDDVCHNDGAVTPIVNLA
jgi:hypothetical protein